MAEPESLPFGRKAPSLVVGQPQALALELFLENAVLLAEVVDCLGLLPVDPAGKRREEELETAR